MCARTSTLSSLLMCLNTIRLHVCNTATEVRTSYAGKLQGQSERKVETIPNQRDGALNLAYTEYQ